MFFKSMILHIRTSAMRTNNNNITYKKGKALGHRLCENTIIKLNRF